MATKKNGLGRGIESLIPEPTIREATEKAGADERSAGEAVAQVAVILSERRAGMDVSRAERMLRMIIALCQSELRGV